MSDLRKKILASKDVREEVIDCPEWDAKVLVKSMTADARARMTEHLYRGREDDAERLTWADMYPQIVVACSYDPDSGERIFTPDDANELAEKSAGPVERIALAGMRLSGLSQDADEELGKDSS